MKIIVNFFNSGFFYVSVSLSRWNVAQINSNVADASGGNSANKRRATIKKQPFFVSTRVGGTHCVLLITGAPSGKLSHTRHALDFCAGAYDEVRNATVIIFLPSKYAATASETRLIRFATWKPASSKIYLAKRIYPFIACARSKSDPLCERCKQEKQNERGPLLWK